MIDYDYHDYDCAFMAIACCIGKSWSKLHSFQMNRTVTNFLYFLQKRVFNVLKICVTFVVVSKRMPTKCGLLFVHAKLNESNTWLGSVTVTKLNLWLRGCGFYSRSRWYQVVSTKMGERLRTSKLSRYIWKTNRMTLSCNLFIERLS